MEAMVCFGITNEKGITLNQMQKILEKMPKKDNNGNSYRMYIRKKTNKGNSYYGYIKDITPMSKERFEEGCNIILE